LQALARRRGDDVDAAFERVGFVEQREAGPATAEERRERLLEVGVDRCERLAEPRVRGLVDLADCLVGLGDRVDQVLALAGQEGVALLEFLRLLDDDKPY